MPVAGGAVALAAIFAVIWGISAWISRGGAESTERLAPSVLRVGDVASVSEEIAESGPLLFPGLNTTSGERTLVLDHRGTDPTRGWRVYWAHPVDRPPSCAVAQVEGTDRFTDCDGRTITVDELAPPQGACPIVEDREDLSLGLRAEACGPASS